MTDTPDTPKSPDDEPTAEEVAAAGAMRPLEELPSPWTVKGNPKMLEKPSLGALSPEDRRTVIDRASGSNDPEALNAALHDFLRERSAEFRLKAGGGQGTTATEREALEQMNQLRLLGDEYRRLEAELAEVREHRTELDASGNAVAVPVYAVQGDGRRGRESRMDEIRHAMALVAGVQGEAALQRAARADALRIRQQKVDAYKHREIKRRAHEMALEEEINAAASNKARFLKGGLG
jgi:hypothetical protein